MPEDDEEIGGRAAPSVCPDCGCIPTHWKTECRHCGCPDGVTRKLARDAGLAAGKSDSKRPAEGFS